MKCPICGSKKKERFVQSFLPHYVYCKNCTGHFLRTEKDVSYPREYFEERGKKSLVAFLLAPILDFFYDLRVRRINRIEKSKKVRIIDYGTGGGKLVALLKKEGYPAFGYEPSPGARFLAKKRGIDLLNYINFSGRKYDLIMFWHSLEHVKDPYEIICKSKRLLTKRGKMLIAVPNAESLEAKIFKEKWFHYTYPLHKIHFTPESLATMLNRVGLKIKNVDYVNPEYTITGLIQSFLNLFLPENILYSVVSHRRIEGKRMDLLVLYSLLMTVLFSPLIILFYLLELILGKTGAVVLLATK